MRLICGLVRFDDERASPETLQMMARALISPGLTPRIRLGGDRHCGLAVIDFSPSARDVAPRLPIGPSDSVLAADLRLDAPDELRRTLSHDDKDEEILVLSALECWSNAAPGRILGDFALAFWNPGTQVLLCARDIFGVRPFAYVHQPGVLFAFASFPRGLHPAIVERKLDEAALARRVLRLSLPGETLFQGISLLPAAHLLEITAQGATLRRFWQFDRAGLGKSLVSAEEAARELRSRLQRAVASRLPAGGGVAAHLSGGLDSSSVSVLAARELRRQGRKLHVYSIRSARPEDYPEDDESPFVQAVLDQEPDMVWAPVHGPVLSDRLEGRMDPDGPTLLEPEPPDAALCRLAAQQGCSLVLSGWGGDEGASFNGRDSLAEAFVAGEWRYLAGELAAVAAVRNTSRWSVFRGEVLHQLSPDWLTRSRCWLRGHPPSYRESARRLLSAAVLARIEEGPEPDRRGPGCNAALTRASLLEGPFTTHRCEIWATIGARHGLGFGFPMLDRRVAELAVSLPASLFVGDGHKRRVFRDAMQGVLPENLRWRRSKFIPLPGMRPSTLADQAVLMSRIDALDRHPRIGAIFDIRQMRSFAANLELGQAPSASTPRLQGAVALVQVLACAAYVEQYY